MGIWAGVKVSRNAPKRRSGLGNAWSVPAAKLFDFTAGTYVPGSSKLATFAIVIRWVIQISDFYDHKFTMLNAFTEFYEIEKKHMKSCLIRSVDYW